MCFFGYYLVLVYQHKWMPGKTQSFKLFKLSSGIQTCCVDSPLLMTLYGMLLRLILTPLSKKLSYAIALMFPKRNSDCSFYTKNDQNRGFWQTLDNRYGWHVILYTAADVGSALLLSETELSFCSVTEVMGVSNILHTGSPTRSRTCINVNASLTLYELHHHDSPNLMAQFT